MFCVCKIFSFIVLTKVFTKKKNINFDKLLGVFFKSCFFREINISRFSLKISIEIYHVSFVLFYFYFFSLFCYSNSMIFMFVFFGVMIFFCKIWCYDKIAFCKYNTNFVNFCICLM